MSSSTPPSVPPGSTLVAVPESSRPTEVKLISHSDLFYWWPVWFLAFVMALWTWVEGNRLAIVPPDGVVKRTSATEFTLQYPDGRTTPSLEDAVNNAGSTDPAFRPRVSQQGWLGEVFVIGLILTMLITNIPLRGLWSFIVIILVVVIALLVSLANGWEKIFAALGDLHIYINMAGYLTIGVVTFVLWAAATFIFDRRSYIIFTPGQIRVCEHIGDAVKVYDAMGVHLEKQRDDLFRHYILGFGSGDLVVRTAGADRHEIKMPNVLGIGWRLKSVEDMLRERTTSVA